MGKKNIHVALISGGYFDSLKILSKIKSSMSDADLSVHESDETFEYVYSRIMEESCFSKKRLHIINEWPKYNTTQPTFMKHFKAMLEKVPGTALVVLNNLPNSSPSFIEFVRDIGKAFVSDTHVPMKNAGQWIAKELATRGVEIELEHASLIATSIGEEGGDWKKGVNIDSLIVEIEKILHYIGTRKVINLKDIQLVCSDSYQFVIFSLFKMFDNRDYCGAIGLINQSVVSGNSIESIAFEILYSMQSRYSLIWNVKESLAAKTEVEIIKERIGRLNKFERTGSGFLCKFKVKENTKGEKTPRFSRAYVDMILQGNYFNKPAVQQYSRKEVFVILEAIHDTLKKIRSGATESDVAIILDWLCMAACRYDIDMNKISNLKRLNHDRLIKSI